MIAISIQGQFVLTMEANVMVNVEMCVGLAAVLWRVVVC